VLCVHCTPGSSLRQGPQSVVEIHDRYYHYYCQRVPRSTLAFLMCSAIPFKPSPECPTLPQPLPCTAHHWRSWSTREYQIVPHQSTKKSGAPQTALQCPARPLNAASRAGQEPDSLQRGADGYLSPREHPRAPFQYHRVPCRPERRPLRTALRCSAQRRAQKRRQNTSPAYRSIHIYICICCPTSITR
jgi:hypothetical protein